VRTVEGPAAAATTGRRVSTLSTLKALEGRSTPAKWFAVENDLIGGWMIATADKPASEQRGEYAVADFLTREDAEFLCVLRNAWPEVSEALRTR
jgi:hypothetical protein